MPRADEFDANYDSFTPLARIRIRRGDKQLTVGEDDMLPGDQILNESDLRDYYARHLGQMDQLRGTPFESFVGSQYSPYRRQADGTYVYDPSQGSLTGLSYNPSGGPGSLQDFLKFALPVFGAGFGLQALLGPAAGAGAGAGAGAATAAGGGAAELASLAELPGFGGVGEIGAGAGVTGAGGAAAGGLELGSVGDPFFDAYTPYGTGGQATGLGASQFPAPVEMRTLPGAFPGTTQFAGGATTITGPGGAASGLLNAASPAASISRLLKEQLGIDVSPGTLGLVGTGLATGLGVLGSQQQNKALQSVVDSQRAVTQPFITDALNMMQNPGDFYQRPEVMGAIDASLRGLSAKVGNPINNPGAIAKQAAFNTGLFEQTLNSRLATALGGQDTLNRLQTQQALNAGNTLNAVGSGLGSMLSTRPNFENLLAGYLLGGRAV